MQSKPLIGLNADFRDAADGKPAFSFLAAGYYDAILAVGGLPVIVPPMADEEMISGVLDRLDGFLLTGGPDLDSRNDGFHLHASAKLMSSRRERFDRALALEIRERRMSVFGIGVGFQLLNLVHGGELHYHIPVDVPNALQHFDAQDPFHRHTLTIESDSIVGRAYGEGEIRVTSQHHMGIARLADGFRITAKCPDGIIEAFESDMLDWFAMGTQFHPESRAASALDISIFEEFVEGVRKTSSQGVRLAA
jgi:putative glutamine amidotransferase